MEQLIRYFLEHKDMDCSLNDRSYSLAKGGEHLGLVLECSFRNAKIEIDINTSNIKNIDNNSYILNNMQIITIQQKSNIKSYSFNEFKKIFDDK